MKYGKEKPGMLVAAMSGGVDSSVAAALLTRDGIEVVGVTLKFFECDRMSEKRKSCCGSDDARQVVNVCDHLGIRHYFLDMRELFDEKVLGRCWDEYASGRTPNPCVFCNRHLKFGALLEYAESLGAGGIITGHYAKIANDENGAVRLSRGEDAGKDQSYFLSLVRGCDLARAFTPLGGLDKSRVRRIARELGLPNAEKRESQDACAGLAGKNFAETLRTIFGGKAKAGNFLDENGKKIGEHDGIHKFTIGQRRGFGKGFGRPLFVKGINAKNGDIVLTGNEEALFSKKLVVCDINWLMPGYAAKESFAAKTQIRYKHEAAEAEIFPGKDASAELVFTEPQRAVSPGQIAVFYDGNSVIGGGRIG